MKPYARKTDACSYFLVFHVAMDPRNPLVIAERKKAYVRNSLFAWIFPCIVVGICVALQLCQTGNVNYGEFFRDAIIIYYTASDAVPLPYFNKRSNGDLARTNLPHEICQ